MYWQTSRRQIALARPLVMGILNVTPDSFSDAGSYASPDQAIRRAASMIADGADIIDIGGESTRPGGSPVDAETEISRTAPVIAAIAARFDTPISIDTTKSAVARAAIDSGAEIINDISGLRFDKAIGELCAMTGCGLVLMHSIGGADTLHTTEKPANATDAVENGLRQSIEIASASGVASEQVVLDVGIGFGKTPKQNFELITRLGHIRAALPDLPFLVGASRKSFLKLATGDCEPHQRIAAGITVAIVSVQNGATIIRTHDVAETVQALRTLEVIDENA